jgi:hypothetical protein
MVLAIFFGLLFFSILVAQCTNSSSNQSPAPGTGATSTPNPSENADPAAVFAESKKVVDEVEARFKKNAENLKKYYGTADEVKQATADVIKLAVVKGLYGKSSAAEEKNLAVRAEAVAEKVILQQRAIYASAMEEVFVKSGMDVKVSAIGAKKDQLKLSYVLMSRPLVYKFQNEMKINEQAKAVGFKKIIYTDGYDETWTMAL